MMAGGWVDVERLVLGRSDFNLKGWEAYLWKGELDSEISVSFGGIGMRLGGTGLCFGGMWLSFG